LALIEGVMFALSRQRPDYSAYLQEQGPEDEEHVLDSGDDKSFFDTMKFWKKPASEEEKPMPETTLDHSYDSPATTSSEEDFFSAASAEQDWDSFGDDDDDDDRYGR